VERLAKNDELAVKTADALESTARRNPGKLIPHLSTLAAHLRSPNLDLRAAVSQVLGQLKSRNAQLALLEALELESPAMLATECKYSCWSGEPLYYWYLHSIQEAEDKHAAELLVYVACGREFTDAIRGCALKQLAGFVGSNNIRIPDQCIEIAQEFSAHVDEKVAEGAIALLGEVEGMTTNDVDVVDAQDHESAVDVDLAEEEEDPTPYVVDFKVADMRRVLRDCLPSRFIVIRPRDFEDMIVRAFRDAGYVVEQTPYSGDFGADLVIAKGGKRIAVQVKRYAPACKVGVQDVNQVIGAIQYYKARKAVVITTSSFTKSAIELAKRAGVELWHWEVLQEFLLKQYPN
jgi:HJR/Mrr/RecB family endonuclease